MLGPGVCLELREIGLFVIVDLDLLPVRSKARNHRKGGPNVLLIMTDDVSFGAPSTFGGVIPTPSLDRVAQMGLRYCNFHSTALISPTRAALITGRNHHSVGFGVVSEQSTGFPGYNSVIGKDSATLGRILQENGYRSSWFGKDHNLPVYQASQAGPFDQWPQGMGFDYFYGFIGGDTSQWQPGMLFRNTTAIHPYVGNPKWNLITTMADDAIHWMNQVNDIDPSMPFFVYYVPGGTHAPHHATPEWIEKAHNLHLFDNGWNALRDQIFANCFDHYVYPEYRLGNIMQTSSSRLVFSEEQKQFGFAKFNTLPQRCRDCQYLFACNGECPKNRLIRTPEGEAGLNYLCSGLLRFWRHIDRDAQDICRRIARGEPLRRN